MYLDFYHLKKAPFHITPDPEFLFLSPSHKAALGSIIYGIEERQGFVAILGEVGLGKTTIVRSYLERVDQKRLKTIYIFNANVSFRSLLQAIYHEFRLEITTDDVFEMVNGLHQVLIEEYKQGRNVALIIDEVQNMPIETLENLRMLSNLETSTEKLIQIVLIGQPEFAHKLELHALRQLKQRLVIRSTIAPLNAAESMAYIQHRLAKVVRHDGPLFTTGALQRIIAQAHGAPRTLNILCTNALIAGFGQRQQPISAKTVRRVITDLAGKRPVSLRRLGFAGSLGLVLCATLFGLSSYKNVAVAMMGNLDPVSHTMGRIVDGIPVFIDQILKKFVVSQEIPSRALEPNRTNVAEEILPSQNRPDMPPLVVQETPPVSQPDHHPETFNTAALPVIRTLGKGDYVSKLALEIYGFTNDELMIWIKKNNPHIQDINKVKIGDQILFPKPHLTTG